MAIVQLSRGDELLEVDTKGARVCRYDVGGVPVVAGSEPVGEVAYRSALLAPWPNRVAGGEWVWESTALRLPVNEPSRNTALHGLVAYEEFAVEASDGSAVVLVHDIQPSPGYPFRLRIVARYTLTDGGLVCVLAARNTGERPAPVALGVHPYLDARGRVDDLTMGLPADSLALGDAMWEVRGIQEVSATHLDFRMPRHIGTVDIDACWTDLQRDGDGRVTAVVGFPDGSCAEVWGGPTCRWLVVYNAFTLPGAAHRASITIEPCTAPANALRSGTDLAVVRPGEELKLDWGLRFHPASSGPGAAPTTYVREAT